MLHTMWHNELIIMKLSFIWVAHPMSFQPWSLCIKIPKRADFKNSTQNRWFGLCRDEAGCTVPAVSYLSMHNTITCCDFGFFFFFCLCPRALNVCCVCIIIKRLPSLIKPARTEHDTHFGGFVSAWISCVVKSLESLREMFPNIVWSMWQFLSFFPPSFFKSTMEVMVICRPGRITVFVSDVADHEFSDVGILSV